MKADVFLMTDRRQLVHGIVQSVSTASQSSDSTSVGGTPGSPGSLPDVERSLNWVRLASRYAVRVKIQPQDPSLLHVERHEDHRPAIAPSGDLVSSAASSTVMSPPAPGRLATFIAFLREELKPRPGRLQLALRITASAVLALWVCMSFHLPSMGIAVYLVFYVPRDGPSKAVKLLAVIAIVCVLSVVYTELLISWGGDSPAIRFAGGAAIIFAGMFMMQAATLGPPWMVLGLLADMLIRSWDSGYPAETSLEGNLWLCLSVVTGVACGVSSGRYSLATRLPESAARRTRRLVRSCGPRDVQLAAGH